MKNRFFNKRIPTILGIILILLGIPLTTFILRDQAVFKSGASSSNEPINIKVTNISDKSFTITYQTDALATGSISYGSNKNLGESELDDTDKERGSFSPKKIHSISAKQLIPATKYYLTITSGSSTFLNNGVPFEATTGPNISSPSAQQNSMSGKIILPDGNASSETLVYLSTEKSQILSSTTTNDGKFIFLLKNLRSDDLSSYLDVDDNTVFKIIATNGSLASSVSASLSQGNSIPTITLSNNYDFSQEATSTASKSAQSLSFPSISLPIKSLQPEITNPRESQTFVDQKPQFNGTSLPNEKVEIIIHSDEQITTQVTADSNGNWTYKPPNNLSPGAHTITIKTRDSSGILTTIVKSFTVFAAETQPSITPFITPSATPFPTLTPIPTLAIIPASPIIVPTTTLTPSPTPVFIQVVTKGGLPPTGDSRTMLVTIAAVATTIAGIVLFLLAQKMPL